MTQVDLPVSVSCCGGDGVGSKRHRLLPRGQTRAGHQGKASGISPQQHHPRHPTPNARESRWVRPWSARALPTFPYRRPSRPPASTFSCVGSKLLSAFRLESDTRRQGQHTGGEAQGYMASGSLNLHETPVTAVERRTRNGGRPAARLTPRSRGDAGHSSPSDSVRRFSDGMPPREPQTSSIISWI